MYESLPGPVLLQLLRGGPGDALCVAERDALEPVGSGLLLEIQAQQAGGMYAPPGEDPGGVDGGGLYIMRKEKAAHWLNEEIERLKLAPAINGCGMTLEWTEQLEIMETLRQALNLPNEWVSVGKGLPELPDASWCSRSVIVCDKDGDVAPLLWARAQVRGKTVERWKYHWGKIYDGPEITHWMPMPAPPDLRPPEGDR